MIAGGQAVVKVQRFLFETSFDGGETAAREPATGKPAAGSPPVADGPATHAAAAEEQPSCAPEAIAETGLTELDLAEEKAKAFQEGEARGREAALAEARAEYEQNGTAVLAQLAERLTEIASAEEKAFLEANRACLALTAAALKKLFPRFVHAAALAEVESVIDAGLSELRQEPRVVLRMQDALLDPIKAQIDVLSQRHGFEGKVVLLADPEMGPSDVRIEFADGGIERCAGQLWADIETRLAEASGQLEADCAALAGPSRTATPPTQDEA